MGRVRALFWYMSYTWGQDVLSNSTIYTFIWQVYYASYDKSSTVKLTLQEVWYVLLQLLKIKNNNKLLLFSFRGQWKNCMAKNRRAWNWQQWAFLSCHWWGAWWISPRNQAFPARVSWNWHCVGPFGCKEYLHSQWTFESLSEPGSSWRFGYNTSLEPCHH